MLPQWRYLLSLVEVKKEERRLLKEFVESNHSYVPNANYFGRVIDYWIEDKEGERVGAISFKSGDLPLPSELHKRLKLPFRIQCRDYYDWHFPNHAFLNNVRYTLVENVVPNFASQVLALGRKRAIKDWKERWGIEVLCFYTYVGGGHEGTTYIADNWIPIGETKGRLTAREAASLGLAFKTYSKKQNWRPQVYDERFKKKIFFRYGRKDYIGMTLRALVKP